MALETIAKFVIDLLKLAPRYFVIVGGFCAFLMFGPENWLRQLALNDLAKLHRQWLGALLVLCSVAVGVECSLVVYRSVRNFVAGSLNRKSIAKRLQSLTEAEKQVLRFYVDKQTRSNDLYLTDGVVQGLESDHIIFRASNIGQNLLFPYNINDFAWEYLNKNPLLLKGTTNTYRTDRELTSRERSQL